MQDRRGKGPTTDPVVLHRVNSQKPFQPDPYTPRRDEEYAGCCGASFGATKLSQCLAVAAILH